APRGRSKGTLMKTHSRRIRSAGLALLFLGTNSTASAQEGPFTPWTGERGVTETVDQIMERQRALPPRPHAVEELDRETIRLSRRPQPNPASPAVSQWPPAANLPAARAP